MRSLFLSIILFSTFIGFSQPLHVNVTAGAANYQGDLQDKKYTFQQAKLALGAGLSYEISDYFTARALLTYATVTAHDKFGRNKDRNLNFTTAIFEGQLAAEYYILNLYNRSISPYLFAGGSVYRFNPFTTSAGGQKTFLQPLSTEGQGILADRPEYKLWQFAVPFGGGIKYAITDDLKVGIEFGMRMLFTDYLDDVSTTYADMNILLAERGQLAVDLAYREDELKSTAVYPPQGTQRGGAKYKDWYYTTMLNLSVRLPEGNGGRRSSKTGCPTGVY